MKNITIDTIKSEPVVSELKLAGKITVNENKVVNIFPMVGGTVTDVKASVGDYVEKGQLLAVMRSSEMANYFNDYKAAESDLSIAKKTREVAIELHQNGISSEKDLMAAESEYQKALAQLNRQTEILKIHGNTEQYRDSVGSTYLINAPISGFIITKKINSGMEIRPDDNGAIFTISDLKEVLAVANVYEKDISRINEGSETRITTLGYPDKIYSGKIEHIANILTPETNVMTLKVSLDNRDYKLKPGMFANISILFPEQLKMLAVPMKAVVFDDNKSFLVHFRKRCDVELSAVNLVKSGNDKYYFECDSLHENDLVIERNALFIYTALKKL